MTRRLWWRLALLGTAVGSAGTVFARQWSIVQTVASAVLLAGIVVLHPLMDQPVPLFGSKLVCRRFYAGVALIVLSIAINF